MAQTYRRNIARAEDPYFIGDPDDYRGSATGVMTEPPPEQASGNDIAKQREDLGPAPKSFKPPMAPPTPPQREQPMVEAPPAPFESKRSDSDVLQSVGKQNMPPPPPPDATSAAAAPKRQSTEERIAGMLGKAPEKPQDNVGQRIAKTVLAFTKFAPMAEEIVNPKYSAQRRAYDRNAADVAERLKLEDDVEKVGTQKAYREGQQQVNQANADIKRSTEARKRFEDDTKIVQNGGRIRPKGAPVEDGYEVMDNPNDPNTVYAVPTKPDAKPHKLPKAMADFFGLDPNEPVDHADYREMLKDYTKSVIESKKPAKDKPIPEQSVEIAAAQIAERNKIPFDPSKPWREQLPLPLQSQALQVAKQLNSDPDMRELAIAQRQGALALMASTQQSRADKAAELNAIQGPEAVKAWVEMMQDNPDIYHEIGNPAVKNKVAQAWRSQTQLPPPVKLDANSVKQESGSQIALAHIENARRLLKDPALQQRLGKVLGRLGNVEQTIGDTFGLSAADAQKAQNLRTSLNYLLFREGQSLLGGRPAEKLIKQLEQTSANVKESMPLITGSLDGAEQSARNTIAATQRLRFNGRLPQGFAPGFTPGETRNMPAGAPSPQPGSGGPPQAPGVTVIDPNKQPHYFRTQALADEFKRRTGIK